MKYNVLIDCGSNVFKFMDKTFSNLTEAIKYASQQSYGNKFIIVKIIDWEAMDKGNS